jgi:hypothetical protein
LALALADQNLIHEEIERRLNSDNACYHLVQNLVTCLVSKNIKIRIYKTMILSLVLYGCENWFVTLRKEHRLRVYETVVSRGMFGLPYVRSLYEDFLESNLT